MSRRRVKGFFIVWWRLWGMYAGPRWSRVYWVTRHWNTLGRGKDFVA